jgi:hypothetical protein
MTTNDLPTTHCNVLLQLLQESKEWMKQLEIFKIFSFVETEKWRSFR